MPPALYHLLATELNSSHRLPLRNTGREGSAIQGQAFISIRLDIEAVDALQLDIDGHSVKFSILSHPRIKLKEQHVRALAR